MLRKLLLSLFLLVCASPVEAAITFVQAAGCETANGFSACTINSSSTHAMANVTAGDAVIVWATQTTNNTTNATISDSASNPYTQTTSGYISPSSNDRRGGMFWSAGVAAINASTGGITCTWSGLSTRVSCIMYEFSGMATSSLEDTSVNSSSVASNQTHLTSGTQSRTNANDALVFAIGVNVQTTAWSAGGGATVPAGGVFTDTNARSGSEYEIVTSTSTDTSVALNFTATSANKTFGVYGAFKAAGGAAAPTAPDKQRRLEIIDSGTKEVRR